MARRTKGQRGLREGWDFTPDGLKAWDDEVQKFEEALFQTWEARTKSRGSRSLDAPDVHDVSRFLLTGLPMPRWKIALRVGISIIYVFAGIMIREAFVGTRTDTEVLLFLGGGVLLAILTGLVQAFLLKG